MEEGEEDGGRPRRNRRKMKVKGGKKNKAPQPEKENEGRRRKKKDGGQTKECGELAAGRGIVEGGEVG
jgi:hypothetical protein